MPEQSRAGAFLRVAEESLGEWRIALVLFAGSLLYLCAFYRHTTFDGDEGTILQGAQRILQGQVLYRDFFSFYAPGSFYWMALLFKIFGSSILVGRAVLLLYGGVFSAFTYLLGRRVCSRWNAMFAILPTVLICLPGSFAVLHNWDSTFWACLALYCAVRLVEHATWSRIFALGLLTSITCLFEQSKGAGLAAGLVLGFLVLFITDRAAIRVTRAQLAAIGLGVASPPILTLAYFGARRALPQMTADLLWPFYHYWGAKVTYGDAALNRDALLGGSLVSKAFAAFTVSPFFLFSALPLFAACALIYWSVRPSKNPVPGEVRRYYVLVSAALSGLLLAMVATGRPDASHIMYQAPLFAVVLGWMAESARSPFLRAARILGVSYALAAFLALGLVFLGRSLGAKHELATRRGLLRTSAPSDGFQYIESGIDPGDKILAYPYQPLYYYLLGTSSVSRYDWLLPGMNAPEQFQEMVRELETSRPRVVLFDTRFAEIMPQITRGVPAQALAARDPVAEYIASHYRACRNFMAADTPWRVMFTVRKDLSCAGVDGVREGTFDSHR